MSDLRPAARIPLLALAILSLAGGVLAGLARLSWDVPAAAIGWHGALMMSTFFGAVISLERAVALGRRWAYLAPAGAGLAGALLLASASALPAQLLLIGAAAVLALASGVVLARLVAPFTVVLAFGAACWLIGNLAWLASGALNAAVPWWLAFLVLTIAGERLELTRVLPTPVHAQRAFVAIIGLLLAGASLAPWSEAAGLRSFAAGLIALGAWLMRHDIARVTVHQRGLTRFIAVCLLCGYAWLALAGALGLAGAFEAAHPWRDAALHAVGLGFVFSMVFGHAPIIIPAVTRVKLPYHPIFYLPLMALQVSLAWRAAGAIAGNFTLRHQGGMANAVALLSFVVVIVVSVGRGRTLARRGAKRRA